MKLSYLMKRGDGIYTYRRAYPNDIRQIIGKREFKRSLGTRDIQKALHVYSAVGHDYNQIVEAAKRGVLVNSSPNISIDNLKKITEGLGIRYLPASQVSKLPKSEQLHRLLTWSEQGASSGTVAAALFGELEIPVTLNDALEIYFSQNKERFAGLNDRELAKARNPKLNAVRAFTKFLENNTKDIREITKDDVKRYKAELQNQVVLKACTAETANKKLGNLSVLFDAAVEEHSYDLPNPFRGIRLRVTKKGKNLPFEINYLNANWFSADVLKGLNIDAKLILLTILDTGCSAKELIGVKKEDIFINQKFPYILVYENDERRLKTSYRERKIPLIGFARYAFQLRPNGFERYRHPNGADQFSAAANKYLKEHNLIPSTKHSVYSLRHTFKDRLRTHQLPPDLQNSLMGHKDPTMGAHYGNGYNTEQTYKYLSKLEKDFNYESIIQMIKEKTKNGKKH